ncbi:MAG: hypothetical protein J0M08_04810 [Bacteroidetes bacterium]|nr:hypothetical protein [Bacteroidota bacterium]
MLTKSTNITKKNIYSTTHFRFLRSGDEFFYFLHELITNAKNEIHLQFYIWEDDETGNFLIPPLLDAIKRGVKIYIVLDAYGSSGFSGEIRNKLESAGVIIKLYSRIFSKKRIQLGRRMHQKIVVVDGIHALVGGINISNNYKGTSQSTAWLDFAAYTRGEVSIAIRNDCIKKWKLAEQKKLFTDNYTKNTSIEKGSISISLLENDWLKGKLEISRYYRQLIRESKQELILVASYFLPGIRLKRLLKKAAKRGVKICFIVPSKSDVAIVEYATEYFYAWMIKNNFSIYKWKNGMVHGKVAIADTTSVTIGSYNINWLSDYGSLEYNIVLHNQEEILSVKNQLQEIIKNECVEIKNTEVEFTYFKKIKNWISFLLVRLSLNVLMLVIKKPAKKLSKK